MRMELAVLGLLMKKNLYGYEIKKRILDSTQGFTNIKFGSITFVIKKGIKNGWIESEGSEKRSGGYRDEHVLSIRGT